MKNTFNFLFIANFKPLPIRTIQDSINAFCEMSSHHIQVLNLHNAENEDAFFELPLKVININCFDGIIIHSTASNNTQDFETIDHCLNFKLADYKGLKVLIQQKAYKQTHQMLKLIGNKKIDLMLTSLSEIENEKNYPQDLVQNLELMHTLPQYVSPFLRNIYNTFESIRNIDIIYQKSISLQDENIQDEITSHLKDLNLNISIMDNHEDYSYDSSWVAFLISAKAILITELSSSAILRLALDAIATKTILILYEDDASSILIPHLHYLPLKRDLSNIKEIIEKIGTSAFRKKMTECAYEEILCNTQYHYETFINDFDRKINDLMLRKITNSYNGNKIPRTENHEVIILVPHELHLDPRIHWMSEGFSDKIKTQLWGIGNFPDKPLYYADAAKPNQIHINIPKMDVDELTIDISFLNEDLMRWFNCLKSTLTDFITYPDHEIYSEKNVARHKWHCRHILTINSAYITLFEELVLLNETLPDLIISVDGWSLLAGVAISQKYHIPLVYDAHEYFALTAVEYTPWEIDFWSRYEKDLLKYTSLDFTVSTPLVEILTKRNNKPFHYLPNCEPLSSYEIGSLKTSYVQTIPKNAENVYFLYQGNYAPSRGLEKLITAWQYVDSHCVLWLRGPEYEYSDQLRKLAKKLNILNKTVFFIDKVTESELVSAAKQADVGLIPYDPDMMVTYQICCPNKLSQYMAAGLPILANNLDYVKYIINEAKCGLTIDFNDSENLVQAINTLAGDKLKTHVMGKNAQRYFLEHFHWEKASSHFYTLVNELLLNKKIIYNTYFNLNLIKPFIPEAASPDLIMPIAVPLKRCSIYEHLNMMMPVPILKLACFIFPRNLKNKIKHVLS